MKTRIFQLLQAADQPVSGEQLSQELGVSRVAVWKHIRQMQAAGCDIQAGPKGYRLHACSDTPAPWKFGDRSARVHHFAELPSTMDKAMELAQAGCDDYSVVVADRQVRGRGRLQRRWQADIGGLYFTMVLRPRLDPRTGPLINLAASLDLAEVLSNLYSIRAQVKWPNDVLVDGRKIAGILSQMAAETDHIHHICLGIGVNVNNEPPDIMPPAVSIAQLTGRPGSRAGILSSFLDRFEQRLKNERLSQVVEEWKRLTTTLGRRVTIQTVQETVTGVAVDLDRQGGLVVALPEGKYRTVFYGDCFHDA